MTADSSSLQDPLPSPPRHHIIELVINVERYFGLISTRRKLISVSVHLNPDNILRLC